MGVWACVPEWVRETVSDINSTILNDKPFATETHSLILVCSEGYTHIQTHRTPQWLVFLLFFLTLVSSQPSQLSKPILLLLHCLGQSDLSRFVWTQNFFFFPLCMCCLDSELCCTFIPLKLPLIFFLATLSIYYPGANLLFRMHTLQTIHCILYITK